MLIEQLRSMVPLLRDAIVRYRLTILISGAAWLYVLCHLDPAGSYPGMPEGPGLTIDETFNVQQGVVLVQAVKEYGLGLLTPEGIRDVFSPPLHLPDHPPLGRWWLGLHHDLVWAIAPPHDPEGPFVTACARAGSATAYALTILLVGCCATAWYGEWAGLMAALAFAFVPRMIGHAHLASLETCTNLTCTAATLAVASFWHTAHPPTWKVASLTGVLLGLALLTKIQGVLLPIPIILWSLVMWRQRAIVPLLIWGGTGCLVFFLGWPWLWLDPVNHLRQYVSGATDRASLAVWLKGVNYTDQTVPWNYSLDYFWWTVPIKLQLIGLLGGLAKPLQPLPPGHIRHPLLDGRMTAREPLLLAASLWPVWFFTLPGVPVYDCERLWLPALPLWLVLVGRGSEIMLRRFQKWFPKVAPALPALIVSLSLVQTVISARYAPVWLSFYGGTSSGLTGAAAMDLERNYWSDAITRGLLEDVVKNVPAGSRVGLTPMLHQFQAEEYWRQSPILRRHNVRLVPYDEQDLSVIHVLVFQRRASLPKEFLEPSPNWIPVSEIKVDGVTLAGLYQRASAEVRAAGRQ